MTQTNEPTPAATHAPENAVMETQPTVTRVNPKWLRNMTIYTALLLALGVWGLVDALVVYPKRGARAAEFFEFQYLSELSQSSGSFTNTGATVADPAGARTRLKQKSSDGGNLTPVESNQLIWLTQLHLIGKGDAAFTAYPRTDFRTDQGRPLEIISVNDRLAALRAAWESAEGAVKGPAPLDWYDIPSQWLFVAFGLGFAPYLLFTVMRARARVYRFDPATHTLTLPNGETVVPADVTEFDKSKWDKVFITLHIRDTHPTLGGKALELDLLRHVPLEAWVLKMEEVKGGPPPAAAV